VLGAWAEHAAAAKAAGRALPIAELALRDPEEVDHELAASR
jgi:hypothetical protein